MSSRRARRSRFLRIVLLVTASTHATFALAAVELIRVAGGPRPMLSGALLAATLFGVFVRRLEGLAPDRRRSRAALHLVDEPYFAHWCAALGSFIPIAGYLVSSVLARGLTGEAFTAPGRFALRAYAAALVLSLWGVLVRRRWVRIRRLEIPIAGLPREFDGYRVVHLSDLHLGGLTPPRWGAAWAARSNALRPDLVAVTGDLVSSGVDFHRDIARVIGELSATDGVFVSMGNHDYFGDGEPLVGLLREAGAVVLRNEGRRLRRGRAELFLAGVDDSWTRRANLTRALEHRAAGDVTLLLSHDPDLFLSAAEAGVELVLSGHTHGGQVALPFFARRVSLGRLTHRFHLGLYREDGSALYVHPGLGTTGPPIRVGVAPEITVLTLRSVERTVLGRTGRTELGAVVPEVGAAAPSAG